MGAERTEVLNRIMEDFGRKHWIFRQFGQLREGQENLVSGSDFGPSTEAPALEHAGPPNFHFTRVSESENWFEMSKLSRKFVGVRAHCQEASSADAAPAQGVRAEGGIRPDGRRGEAGHC